MLRQQKTQNQSDPQRLLPQRSSVFQRSDIPDVADLSAIPSVDSSFRHEFSQIPTQQQSVDEIVYQRMDYEQYRNKPNNQKKGTPPKKPGKNGGDQGGQNVSLLETPKLNKKRTLTSKQAEHIFLGEEEVEESKRGNKKVVSITGYHSKVEGGKAVAEGFGKETTKDFGCYVQAVRHRIDNTVVKKNASTFYPTSWTREEIVQAIEYASGSGNVLYVTVPKKGEGMALFSNGASYFPYFEN